MGIFASRMEGNIVLFLGTSRRSESERQQKVLSILFFEGDAKIIGNLFYDKIFFTTFAKPVGDSKMIEDSP